MAFQFALQLPPTLQLAPVFPVCRTLFQQSVSACVMFCYLVPACAPCPVLFQHALHSSSLCALFQTVRGCFPPFTGKLSTLYMLIRLPQCSHFAPGSTDQYINTKNSRHSYSSADNLFFQSLLNIRNFLFCKFPHYYCGFFFSKGSRYNMLVPRVSGHSQCINIAGQDSSTNGVYFISHSSAGVHVKPQFCYCGESWEIPQGYQGVRAPVLLLWGGLEDTTGLPGG